MPQLGPPTKLLMIVRGVHGSGKHTFCRMQADNWGLAVKNDASGSSSFSSSRGNGGVAICSPSHFAVQSKTSNDVTADSKALSMEIQEYGSLQVAESLDPRLKRQHLCMRQFLQAVEERASIIFLVDVFPQRWQYRNFQSLARLLGYSSSVIQLFCESEEQAALFAQRSTLPDATAEKNIQYYRSWEKDENAIQLLQTQFHPPAPPPVSAAAAAAAAAVGTEEQGVGTDDVIEDAAGKQNSTIPHRAARGRAGKLLRANYRNKVADVSVAAAAVAAAAENGGAGSFDDDDVIDDDGRWMRDEQQEEQNDTIMRGNAEDEADPVGHHPFISHSSNHYGFTNNTNSRNPASFGAQLPLGGGSIGGYSAASSSRFVRPRRRRRARFVAESDTNTERGDQSGYFASSPSEGESGATTTTVTGGGTTTAMISPQHLQQGGSTAGSISSSSASYNNFTSNHLDTNLAFSHSNQLQSLSNNNNNNNNSEDGGGAGAAAVGGIIVFNNAASIASASSIPVSSAVSGATSKWAFRNPLGEDGGGGESSNAAHPSSSSKSSAVKRREIISRLRSVGNALQPLTGEDSEGPTRSTFATFNEVVKLTEMLEEIFGVQE